MLVAQFVNELKLPYIRRKNENLMKMNENMKYM